MGQANTSIYVNGDIPRDNFDIFNTKGYVYYHSSVEGVCTICNEPTYWWSITIKSKGKYICRICDMRDKNKKN